VERQRPNHGRPGPAESSSASRWPRAPMSTP
jgi:hypothetical protein